MPSPNRTLIRETRQAKGMKVSELAERARVKVQHLANIESGHAVASVEVLQRIANELGLTRDELIERRSA